ncbi:rhodanese-like domain-containing protein [Thiohalophilus thiocyanatoxydans]|uniref:Rhodanese-related sulfurtransferase n=1 Tax=Thiohalophilus thiocyanatoxydans TaxID=381308 RepID=A0A4R8J1D0_9GAMM|nr:rhodanese-like domain-containing protein [Thiohalophilus thiocyanatoxydans]TDY04117.1 rhodanese-related sulfurtransferase [Thiohalophilus thiocyanatoxydans]
MKNHFLAVSGAKLILLLVFLSNVVAADEEEIIEHIPGVNKVSAEELIELANQIPELLIIDSRIVSDRAHGYIEGSNSLPDTDTDCDSLAETIPDKTHPTLFYCNGPKCGRSANAVQIAKQCGYTNLHWFFGGFEEWQDKKYPYVKDKQ